ncbi:glycerophosphodiester phosphodiesterase [Auraticoccus monumenti]|uniref:Glycerophosphoryl diester phosphodiesterase n=1 Tax=Auraticoccus monumenti TaxID=675864 RepID=A0A1G7BN34_9ACTN|nr:glycerophosphodiester phosphodiesterase [Auraticoccus monumenti]SDE28322.1 glycerophosphoryl diester phosphodiesterase [Auraticoccus monumenti]
MAPRPTSPFPAGRTIALAHRGGAALQANLGRENTVAAFAEAVRLGYRYLETDVHTTSDHTLVAFHDDVLDRVTDARGTVAELPWSEVSQARIGGEPVPTLDELLETFPEAVFNIDIKAAGAVEPLLRTLARHDALGRVCVGSFSGRRLRHFRRLSGGRVATSAAPDEVAALRFARSRVAGPAVALQVPVERVVAGRRVPIVTPGLLRRAHATGRQVHVWTVDDPAQMHALLDLGVDGLVSDAIDTLKRVLTDRGCWE